VSRVRLVLSRYGLDLLIGVAAVEVALTTALRDDLEHPSGPWLWFEVLAITAVVLALLARRRFPFAAPAATWLACAALSFVDGRLIVDEPGIFVVGMGAAVLLGNQRSVRQAGAGLVIVLACAGIVVANEPGATAENLVSVPVLFGIGWHVGYELRERT